MMIIAKKIGAKLRSSLPGLTRQSIDLRKNFLAKKMDARVKPAHDELAKQLKLAPMESSPRVTVESSGSIRAVSAVVINILALSGSPPRRQAAHCTSPSPSLNMSFRGARLGRTHEG
jgi:hypothetical protein